MGSFSQRLKAMDIYRRIPKDLTEATLAGGSISLVAMGLCAFLFFVNLWGFFTVETITHVHVDHSQDGLFRMNFNITFDKLSCEYASVDLKNKIGGNRENIHDKSVHKFSTDGSNTWQGYASKKDTKVHLYDGTNKDHYGNKQFAIELSADDFDRMTHEYHAVIVDFHAPWCIHCRNLAPIYQHAAEIVKQKSPSLGIRFGTHDTKNGVMLATVDCTTAANRELCRSNGIQAFPSIHVFREGTDQHAGQSELHESYHGDRTADKLAEFALKVFKEVADEYAKGSDDAKLAMGEGTDADSDGQRDSLVRTKGCRIEGYVMLARVPGQLIIRPHSTGAQFDTGLVNMSHSISHLSFGIRDALQTQPLKLGDMDGAYADMLGSASHADKRWLMEVSSLMAGNTRYTSETEHVTHEHYLKVVSTDYRPIAGKTYQTYEYATNTNQYKEPDKTPTVRIHYDLSPLRVVSKEVRKSFFEWFTSMCAIVGGVYTFSSLVENTVNTVSKVVNKKKH